MLFTRFSSCSWAGSHREAPSLAFVYFQHTLARGAALAIRTSLSPLLSGLRQARAAHCASSSTTASPRPPSSSLTQRNSPRDMARLKDVYGTCKKEMKDTLERADFVAAVRGKPGYANLNQLNVGSPGSDASDLDDTTDLEELLAQGSSRGPQTHPGV